MDGIYPRWSTFVKTINPAIDDRDKKFSKWQESARKDMIERAFGVLQCSRFKAVLTPIQQQMDLKAASNLVGFCLILHHIMLVEDKIMGKDSRETYNPSNSVQVEDDDLQVQDAQEFPPGAALDDPEAVTQQLVVVVAAAEGFWQTVLHTSWHHLSCQASLTSQRQTHCHWRLSVETFPISKTTLPP